MAVNYAPLPDFAARSDSLLAKPTRPSVHTAITANFVAVTTPPLTPMSPPDHEPTTPSQALFHNYLRALHDFDPRASAMPGEDASLVTAKLKAGDLILVHCIHANGWADGTVLNTGERAWLPTNYCEGYDHPYLRNLLNAMTQFWDLLGASEDANLSTFVRQDYIRGLIAGVRYLLERADCLHRDFPLVKAHVGVRRMRKGLLADLSSLVQIAKRLQETISEPFAGEVIHVLLEDLITKACKVVTRAVSFVDVWTQETGDDLNWLSVPEMSTGTATTTNEQESSLEVAPLRLKTDTKLSVRNDPPSAADSAKVFPEQVSGTMTPDTASISNPLSPADDRPAIEPFKRRSRASMVFTPPTGTVAHRLSHIQRSPPSSHHHHHHATAPAVPLASEQLAKAHDICISHIGAFIGHHLHSRPCAELVATTDRLVHACTNLLTIVDAVCAHDPAHAPPVLKAKGEFEAKVQELARSTKDVFFKFSDDYDSEQPDEQAIMLPDQSSHLIAVGTGLIRNTGECVVKTRQVIEMVGDFELKSWVVVSPTSSTFGGSNSGEPAAAKSAAEDQAAAPPASAAAAAAAVPAEPEVSPPSPPKRYSYEKRLSLEKRLSRKMLPPPPPLPSPPPRVVSTEVKEPISLIDAVIEESPVETHETSSTPSIGTAASVRQSLPSTSSTSTTATVSRHRSTTRTSDASIQVPAESLRSPRSMRSDSISPARKDSIGMSISGSTDTFASSLRDSSLTAHSQVSTRATTPDQTKDGSSAASSSSTAAPGPNNASSTSVASSTDAPAAPMLSSFASVSDLRSLVTDDSNDPESALLQKTYANELTLNKDGQVSGGSLPALVEQLTTHDAAPDPIFVTAFFITFRKFCEPREFAQALLARYDYIGDSKTIGTPVRLRIFNVFKHWLETYWNPEADKDALGEIRYFALHKLKQHLPAAGERLVELTRRVTAAYREGMVATGPLVSGVGKTAMSIVTQYESDAGPPEPLISKHQLNALRLANGGGAACNIIDFDAMEIARQITQLTMQIFCAIRAEELLSMDWSKSGTKKAPHIRQMCTINTDLANFVGDTILAPDDAKKRAGVIKHWSKVGHACLQLRNYDSLMAIMASINSSVVQRLKRTWELVSKKTRARLDELDQVCDMSKNYTALRTRLATPVAPCLPFVGIYLTDLTFVIAGNPKRRELPGTSSNPADPRAPPVSVINFDMYLRMARIITHLHKFQNPYKLADVPEMQTWLQAQLARMRQGHDQLVSSFHRRSLYIEPKQAADAAAAAAAAAAREGGMPTGGGAPRKLSLVSPFLSTSSSSTPPPPMPTTSEIGVAKDGTVSRKNSVAASIAASVMSSKSAAAKTSAAAAAAAAAANTSTPSIAEATTPDATAATDGADAESVSSGKQGSVRSSRADSIKVPETPVVANSSSGARFDFFSLKPSNGWNLTRSASKHDLTTIVDVE